MYGGVSLIDGELAIPISRLPSDSINHYVIPPFPQLFARRNVFATMNE